MPPLRCPQSFEVPSTPAGLERRSLQFDSLAPSDDAILWEHFVEPRFLLLGALAAVLFQKGLKSVYLSTKTFQ